MRIVLDTNILVRANPQASPQGLARELLLTAVSKPHALLVSAALLTETRRVFAYPHVARRWPLTQEAIEQYLSLLAGAGVFVDKAVEDVCQAHGIRIIDDITLMHELRFLAKPKE